MATAKKSTPDVVTKSVKALVPVHYDGVAKVIDEVFEIREADLEQLLEVKAVSELRTDPTELSLG